MSVKCYGEVDGGVESKKWVKYSDGVEGEVDLSHLVGKGVFSLWNDYSAFQKVYIGSSGEIAWSDKIDICPDSIYMKITGKTPGELFPNLKNGNSPCPRLAGFMVSQSKCI